MHQVQGVVARAKGEPVTIETIHVPDPGPGEALVKIQTCGVCHTDLHVIKAEVRFPTPCVLGHEVSGAVVAHGPGLSAADAERLAIGDLTVALPGPSPCGRSNMRIKGWMGRADQTTKVKGMFVRPEQVAEVAKRHLELTRVRLVVTREAEQDAMTLQAECASPSDGFEQTIAETLQAVTKLKGAVKLVAPGTLPNDGKVIADERPVG